MFFSQCGGLRLTLWHFYPLCLHCFQVARGGQSVTLVGSKLVMFGGEDRSRRLLNDVQILDLETMTWSAVETT